MLRAVIFLILAISSISAQSVVSDEQAVKDTLAAYEDAWSRHDPDAIASFYYEPALRVGKGGPNVRPTRADQKVFFTGFLPGLVERGYSDSVWESLEVRLLDDQTALASGVIVRRRADKTVLERVALTYALRSTPDGWKIFMSATHAPDSALHFR
jgi:ketosteroid isomerase-like protein